MALTTIEHFLSAETESALRTMLDDRQCVFLVDHREEDDAIVGYCERILQTGDLAVEVLDTDADPGLEIHISHRGRRVQVPLSAGPEDRHITIHTLNELLKPAFEIRVCVASNGSDSLAFLPLSALDWSSLESRFGAKVGKHFRKIERRPNLFTDPW